MYKNDFEKMVKQLKGDGVRYGERREAEGQRGITCGGGGATGEVADGSGGDGGEIEDDGLTTCTDS